MTSSKADDDTNSKVDNLVQPDANGCSDPTVGPSEGIIMPSQISKPGNNSPDEIVLVDQSRKHCEPESITSHQNLMLEDFSEPRDYLSETVIELFSDSPMPNLDSVTECPITPKFFQISFLASMYSVHNYFGKPSPGAYGPEKLLEYLYTSLPLDEKKEELTDKARSTLPPVFFLHIKMKEANIKVKEGVKFRNVFCSTWISSLPDSLESTRKETNVKHPVWNENLYLQVKNIHKDEIFIDIFAKRRTRMKNIMKSTGCLRCYSSCGFNFGWQDSKKSNLIATTKFCVSDIYTKGILLWIPMKAITKRAKVKLLVEMRFEVSPPKQKINSLKRHLVLVRTWMHVCNMKKESGKSKIDSWTYLFEQPAHTIIFLHSVISALTTCEDMVSRFVILIDLGLKDDLLSYKLLYDALYEIVQIMERRTIHKDTIDNCLLDLYIKKVHFIHSKCCLYVAAMHTFRIVEEEAECMEFEFILRTLFLCEEVTHVNSSPLKILKSEANDYFESKAMMLMGCEVDNVAKFLIEFLDQILKHQKCADVIMKKVLTVITYTSITFEHLDTSLWQALRFHIQLFSRSAMNAEGEEFHLAKQDGIELFTKMKNFVSYLSTTAKVPIAALQIAKYNEWFGIKLIKAWFEDTHRNAEQEIVEAVASDDLEPVAGDVEKRSESAIAVSNIIDSSLTLFWDTILCTWSGRCNVLFVKTLNACCLKYLEELMQLIPKRNLSEKFHSDGRKKIYTIANNLWAMSSFVDKVITNTVGNVPTKGPNPIESLKSSCTNFCKEFYKYVKQDVAKCIYDAKEGKTKFQQDSALKVCARMINRLLWKEAYEDMSVEVFTIFRKEMWVGVMSLLNDLLKEYGDTKEHMVSTDSFHVLEMILLLEEMSEMLFMPENKRDLPRDLLDEEYEDLKSYLRDRIDALHFA